EVINKESASSAAAARSCGAGEGDA
ncbi:hypothetical protein A2U01_0055126, partial [Trifolium medium]|nr:hypothetical protein [Trifolium medium]